MKSTLLLLVSGLLVLTSCQGDTSKDQRSIMKIAFHNEPSTLDPRIATDLECANVLQMIYEGLIRIDYHGHVTPGIAESYEISSDFKTYTFNLRESQWSDNTPLSALDFENTWKSLLDPSFPAPNAYQFYYIKGAKQYKEGKGSWEDVGIKTNGLKQLIVELENPTPYFLKLAASYFYFPVSPQMRLKTSNQIVSNGCFKIKEWSHNDQLTMIKNPLYWDTKVVSIDELCLIILDEDTSYKMFEMGQLDRTGSPTATLPQDAIPSLKRQNQLKVKPAAATHWFRFNTQKAPFNNVKLRKAFNLALNRKAIVDHVTQGDQTPASGIVPPIVGWDIHSYYKDHDIPGAWQLLQEALLEMNLDKDSLPPITLLYSASDRNHKIAQAVQQQWNHALGLQIKLKSLEGKIFSEKVLQGDYQVSTGSWYADFSDPINFLEIFKFKNNSSNRTGWENLEYVQLLNISAQENDHAKRMHYLKEAERILIDEVPVAPLFFGSFNYLESDHVGGVALSDLGILDFKYAFIDEIAEQ